MTLKEYARELLAAKTDLFDKLDNLLTVMQAILVEIRHSNVEMQAAQAAKIHQGGSGYRKVRP